MWRPTPSWQPQHKATPGGPLQTDSLQLFVDLTLTTHQPSSMAWGRASVEFRSDGKRNYRSLDTETTVHRADCQNATRFDGTLSLQSHLHPQQRGLPCAGFHETHKCSAALCAHLLCRFSSEPDAKCTKHWHKVYTTLAQSHSRPQVTYGFPFTNFHKTLSCPTELCGDQLYRISPRSVKKYAKYGAQVRVRPYVNYDRHCSLVHDTYAVQRRFVKNSYTELHENPLNGLVADTTSQTDGRTWSPHKASFFHFA
jgi:hypothetical protein